MNKDDKEIKSSRYSVFKLSDKFFALEISKIKEVLDRPAITYLPNARTHFLGVFNLRGKIITMVDARQLLSLNIPDRDTANMVILVEYDSLLVGMLVDQVMDFMHIEEIKIQLPSRKIPTAIANYILGYFEKENFGTVYLLDLVKLIQSMRT
jgi:purine-binding chemotaxis protein CheW